MLILNLFQKELGVVIEKIMLHTLKNFRYMFLAVLLTKLFVLMINLVDQLFFTINRFIETILKEYDYRKSVIKKHFNKNLVMPENNEQRFQSSSKCWIRNKLFHVGDLK